LLAAAQNLQPVLGDGDELAPQAMHVGAVEPAGALDQQHRIDDVPGTAANPEFFSSLQHLTCQGCNWGAPSGLYLWSDSNRYDYAWDTNLQFRLWTK